MQMHCSWSRVQRISLLTFLCSITASTSHTAPTLLLPNSSHHRTWNWPKVCHIASFLPLSPSVFARPSADEGSCDSCCITTARVRLSTSCMSWGHTHPFRTCLLSDSLPNSPVCYQIIFLITMYLLPFVRTVDNTMETLIFSSNVSLFTITKLPAANMFLELFLLT